MKRAGATGDATTATPSPPPKGRVAYNEQRLEEARNRRTRPPGSPRSHLDHQQERRQAITNSAPRRREFETATAQLDAALDYTRPQRVHALDMRPLT